MRESKFVDQNKEKWEEIESYLKNSGSDPQQLRHDLMHITDDLSYSRTFYKNRSVRIYLNGLAQSLYNNIYKGKKNALSSFKKMIFEEAPKVMFHARKELLFVFCILLISISIGIFSSRYDEGFARAILSDAYVEKTLENIENGDPLNIYKDEGQFQMFVSIAQNNIRVSLIIFAFGLFFSYGSVLIVFFNGIMLGTFMYFFYSRGLSTDFNLTVWMHGTVEILTMVVVGVAGLLLGKGLVNPGTLSRRKAFSVWGRKGAMVFMIAIPFILFAAFVESFLTRYTEFPNSVRLIFILFNLFVMVYYFVIYPYMKYRKSLDLEPEIPELEPDVELEFEKGKIYSNGEIILKSLFVFGKGFQKLFVFSILISLALTAFTIFNMSDIEKEKMKMILAQGTGIINFFFDDRVKGSTMQISNYLGLIFKLDVLTILVNLLWLAALVYRMVVLFIKHVIKEQVDEKKVLIYSVLISFILNLVFALKFPFKDLAMIFSFLLVSTSLFYKIYQKHSFSKSERMWDFMRAGIFRQVTMSFLFYLLMFVVLLFIYSGVGSFIQELVLMNLNLNQVQFQKYYMYFGLFVIAFILNLALMMLTLFASFLTYSMYEMSEANDLRLGIENIGKKKRMYGIETE
jgi:uncharacterized membrane protein SpoIIM required for sporulation